MNSTSLYTKCIQCPRACGADRTKGGNGFCGEDESVRAALACLHFGEEPPVTVLGGSGAIFFTGCTLRCAFCQNYQISQNGYGAVLTKDDFIKICLDLQNAGAENINLITLSHHIPLAADFIRGAKEAGVTIPFCWNSSAYESVESLELLKGLVDIWLPDLKTLDADFAQKLFGAAGYPAAATRAIEWMIKNHPLTLVKAAPSASKGKESPAGIESPKGLDRGASSTSKNRSMPCGIESPKGMEAPREKIMRGVIVRHLFMPGRFEDTANVLDWLKHNADGRAMVSLMSQYTPVPFNETDPDYARRKAALSQIQNRLVSIEEDSDLRDIIAAYDFENLFYQELVCDTSWLPDFTRAQPFSNELAKVLWHC